MRRLAPEASSVDARGGHRPAAAGLADAGVALVVAALAAVLALALLSPIDANNDQALFLYYAERLREGAAPYLDIWDNKQPGIFAFYAGAAALFGEGWPAARTAFALWLAAGAGVIALIARRVAPGTIAWWLAPLVTVGLALVRNDIERPAQVESLVGLPLAGIVLLGLVEPARPAARLLRWIAVGALVGVVSSLKLVLAPVAAAIIAVLLTLRLLRRELSPAAAMVALAATGVGFVALWAPILAWIAAHGAWAEFRWTMLDYPRLALLHVEVQKPAQLIGALRWLAVTTAPLLPAAALAAWQAVRAPRTPTATLVFAALAWCGVGLVMIVMQRFSWWNTHMDLLVWPVGLMAAVGLAQAVSGPWQRRLRGVAVAVLVLGLAFHVLRFARDWVADPDWPGPREEVASLATAATVAASAVAPCGTVYAIGDQPGVERVTGLRQALPTHGLWFGAFLPEQAGRLPGELRSARPDLVYFDRNERRDFQRKFPDSAARIEQWLAGDYRPVATDAMGGVWYQRNVAPGDGASCPPPLRFTIPGGAAGAR